MCARVDHLPRLTDPAGPHRIRLPAQAANVRGRASRDHAEERPFHPRRIDWRGRRRWVASRLSRPRLTGRVEGIVVVLVGRPILVGVGQRAVADRDRASRRRLAAGALVQSNLIGVGLAGRIGLPGRRIRDTPPVLPVVQILLAGYPRVGRDADHAAVEPGSLIGEVGLELRPQALGHRARAAMRMPAVLGDQNRLLAETGRRHLAPQPADQGDVPVGVEVVEVNGHGVDLAGQARHRHGHPLQELAHLEATLRAARVGVGLQRDQATDRDHDPRVGRVRGVGPGRHHLRVPLGVRIGTCERIPVGLVPELDPLDGSVRELAMRGPEASPATVAPEIRAHECPVIGCARRRRHAVPAAFGLHRLSRRGPDGCLADHGLDGQAVLGEPRHLGVEAAPAVAVQARDRGGRLGVGPRHGIAHPADARCLDVGQIGVERPALPLLVHQVEVRRAHSEERAGLARDEGIGHGRDDEDEHDGDRREDAPEQARTASGRGSVPRRACRTGAAGLKPRSGHPPESRQRGLRCPPIDRPLYRMVGPSSDRPPTGPLIGGYGGR